MKHSDSGSKLALGIMSGTSADGIDVALVRLTHQGPQFENFLTVPFRPSVREAILRVAEGKPTTTEMISQLNFLLGEDFAEAALTGCRKFRVRTSQIAWIGSHGQTVFHQGVPSTFCGWRVASTLQIGDPSVIARRTGIITVGDFRTADMAAGGQGAPLVPFVDFLLYRHRKRGRTALNVGGIANITVIPANARIEQVFAFDTGPGNMVVDALVRHYTNGRKRFDRGARMALRGKLLPVVLEFSLRDPYYRRPPPKTAGREQFGETYLHKLLSHPDARRARPEDVVHTATILTAASISEAFRRFVLTKTNVAELILSGGGTHNPLIRAQIQAALPGVALRRSRELGVPEDGKEAFAFAVLGGQTLRRRPGNVPRATGAKRAVVLGKICYP